jgi:hypothetical protein
MRYKPYTILTGCALQALIDGDKGGSLFGGPVQYESYDYFGSFTMISDPTLLLDNMKQGRPTCVSYYALCTVYSYPYTHTLVPIHSIRSYPYTHIQA